MLIDEIIQGLNSAKETGRVDPSLLNNMDALANQFKEFKEKWLLSPNTKVNLYFYYGARVAELVVSRMKERFLSSTQADGNPETIANAPQIVGLLGDILALTQKKLPDQDSTKRIIELSKELKRIATDMKLLQTEEKELQDVDKLLGYMSRLRR